MVGNGIERWMASGGRGAFAMKRDGNGGLSGVAILREWGVGGGWDHDEEALHP